ncbi:hypothetical protein BDV98DRAFT_259843 [Pterulicium gracile]|uniref:Uncharacterized protein n=1 Tax=Pterulicium gracile TaxID=1884261 RepID=A0A5C3QBP5_9AGAR|nr:hypothetical protein BDV98DRAFT_259843 [Pterula gracilis]
MTPHRRPTTRSFFPTTTARGHPANKHSSTSWLIHGGGDGTIAYGGGARKGKCLPAIPHYVKNRAGLDGLGSNNGSRALTNQAKVYEFGTGGNQGRVTHVYAGDRVGHS